LISFSLSVVSVCREHGVEVLFEDDANALSHVDEQTVCMQPFSTDADGEAIRLAFTA